MSVTTIIILWRHVSGLIKKREHGAGLGGKAVDSATGEQLDVPLACNARLWRHIQTRRHSRRGCRDLFWYCVVRSGCSEFSAQIKRTIRVTFSSFRPNWNPLGQKQSHIWQTAWCVRVCWNGVDMISASDKTFVKMSGVRSESWWISANDSFKPGVWRGRQVDNQLFDLVCCNNTNTVARWRPLSDVWKISKHSWNISTWTYPTFTCLFSDGKFLSGLKLLE